MNKHRIIALGMIVLFAALLRFLPQPPNFTPIAALALFSGVFFTNRLLACLVPVGVLLVTDLFLGWHSTILFVYGSFAIMVLIGYAMRGHLSVPMVTGAGLSASLLFFLVTNFGVWATGTMYPKTWEGLAAAYIAGIPFFHYMIAGTLFYSALFFGSYLLASRQFPSLLPSTISPGNQG